MRKALLMRVAFLASTLGLLGAMVGADAPDVTDDEKTVDAVCQSAGPMVIVDYFSMEEPDYGRRHHVSRVDIDGDRLPDVQHGDIEKKIATLSGRNVITYGLGGDHNSVSDADLTNSLSHIITMIKNGKIEKPSAVSLSIERPSTPDDIHGSFGADLALTKENVAAKKGEIIARMIAAYGEKGTDDKDINFFYQTYRQFEELKELGVPVITVAGNRASKNSGAFNMLSILGGVSIGALTHDGGEISTISNQNSLTSVYRVGEFKTYRVDGGVDINGDGKMDFPSHLLSNNQERIASTHGEGSSWGATVKGTSFAAPNICGKGTGPNKLAWLEKIIK